MFSIPLVAFFVIYAQPAIMFLAGSAYQAAIAPMQLIMPSLFLIAMSYPLGIQVLVPLGKEKIVLCSEIAGAIVNVLVNILLIPKFGVAGAAISNVCAEFTVLTVQFVSVQKEMKKLLLDISWWKIMAATIMAVASISWIKTLNIGGFWMLAFSGVGLFAVYGVVLLLLKETMVFGIVHTILKKILKK